MKSPYIFVSHASADKARIKPVLVALVREGVRLWVDKPYHPDLNLPEEHFAGFIKREVAGEIVDPSRQIDLGLSGANGMLIFPSAHSKSSEQVNVEMGMAHGKRQAAGEHFQITPCFVDSAAYDLAEWRVSKIQGFSTTVKERGSGKYSLTKAGVLEVRRLAQKLNDHLERMQVVARKTRQFGSFDNPDRFLTAEQTSALLLMLDRETVVQDLVDNPKSLLLLTGPQDAGARRLVQRLPQFELPFRSTVASRSISEGMVDTAKAKAALIAGVVGDVASHTWQHRSVSWCDDSKLKVDDAFRDVATRIASSILGSYRAPSGHEGAGWLAHHIKSVLAQSRRHVFLWTEIKDSPRLRQRNQEIVLRLSKELNDVDPAGFRFLIHVPSVRQPFGIQTTEEWLKRRLCRTIPEHRTVVLNRVSRSQLIEWEHLSSLVATSPLHEIQRSVEAIFKGGLQNGMHMVELEAMLEPIVAGWTARSTPTSGRVSGDMKGWTDAIA